MFWLCIVVISVIVDNLCSHGSVATQLKCGAG